MGNELNLWVKQELEHRGWSMRELARRSELSHSHISRVLTNQVEPGAKFYHGIAKAFEVQIDAIEQLDKEGRIPDEQDKEEITLREFIDVMSGASSEELRERFIELFVQLKSNRYSTRDSDGDDVDDSQTDEEDSQTDKEDGEIEEGDEPEEN